MGRARNPGMCGLRKDLYVGDEAFAHRGVLRLTYPLKWDGSPINFECFEGVMRQVMYSELRTSPEDNPIICTTFPRMDNKSFEKMGEIVFEYLHHPYFCLVDSSVLSLLASGLMTGTVLDSGGGITKVVSVSDGYPLSKTHFRLENPTEKRKRLAGDLLTDYLVKLLSLRGYDMSTKYEREIVRDIKEKICYVSLNYEEELERSVKKQDHDETQEYELPDGSKMTIGNERFRTPEVFFKPNLLGYLKLEGGVHELVLRSIQSIIDFKEELFFSNIVLAGGSTMFPGFGERLELEIIDLLLKQQQQHKKDGIGKVPVKVKEVPFRKFSAWIGGSIFSVSPAYKNEWISIKEYEEQGAGIIRKKSIRTVWEEEDKGYIRYLRRVLNKKNRFEDKDDLKERILFCSNLNFDWVMKCEKKIIIFSCSSNKPNCVHIFFLYCLINIGSIFLN